MFFDIAMFFLFYRSIPAFFALTDFGRVPSYLAIRKVTFYIHSGLMLLALLSTIAMLVWSKESPSWQVTISVAVLLAVYVLLDLHFQKCLQYFVDYNMKEEKKNKEDKQRALEKINSSASLPTKHATTLNVLTLLAQDVEN